MQDFVVAAVRDAERRGDERRLALRTRADAEAYVADVRQRLASCLGPWPERTPLKARTTRVLERDTYRIETVVFESRPGYLVTANLYLPRTSQPVPAVLGACGHYELAKAAPDYQSFAQGLARLGYAVLIYDPVGQGERAEYLDDAGRSRLGASGVIAHLKAGNQQVLVGESFPSWVTWDGHRALDYLLSRPEVDPRHIGLTGNSGGGTQSTWLCATDPRITMAAPGCFLTTFRRNAENELVSDTEQCPPGVLALGLDQSDFYAAFAPRPLLLLGQERDFFDARGLETAAGRLRQLYRLLGAEENLRLHVGPGPHGYSPDLRLEMYRWFNRITGRPAVTAEPALTLEKPEDLRATPTGSVAAEGGRTVFAFTREKALALARARGRAPVESARLAARLPALLRLPARPAEAPEYRILQPARNRPYPRPHAASYLVETEPPAAAMVYLLDDQPLYSRPPRGRPRALLYVSDQSADAELREDAFVRGLMTAEPAGTGLYACDLRGTGESRPDTGGVDFREPYGPDFFLAAHGLMLDRPYVGQRTHDLLRLLDWLAAQGHTEVHLAASGWGTPPATFAALLSPLVRQVTLHGAPTGYGEIATTSDYDWPLSSFVPGILADFDLPDCYAALAAKDLRQVAPRGAAQISQPLR